MKEAIGGAWLFQIVIVVVLLFTAILCITINYTKAFKVKNGVVEILERREGFNEASKQEINDFLIDAKYYNTGSCQDPSWAGFNVGNKAKVTDEKVSYCIKRVCTGGNGLLNNEYYKIEVFFNVDVPIIGNFVKFSIKGDTKTIIEPEDDSSLFNNEEEDKTTCNNEGGSDS